jgi:hypothetical protein
MGNSSNCHIIPNAKNFVATPFCIKTFEFVNSIVVVAGSLHAGVAPGDAAIVLEPIPDVTNNLG